MHSIYKKYKKVHEVIAKVDTGSGYKKYYSYMKLILYTDTEINVSTSVYNTPLQRICAVNSTQLFPNLSATAFSSASRSYRRKCVYKASYKNLDNQPPLFSAFKRIPT